MKKMTYVAAATVASTLLCGVNLANAGLLPVNAAAVSAAAPNEIVDVRYYGGGAFIAGAAIGLIGAAIAANSYYYPSYYYPYPAYSYPAYPYYYPGYYRPYPYWRPRYYYRPYHRVIVHRHR